MGKTTRGKGKREAPLPSAAKKKVVAKKATNPLFSARTRNFGIGNAIQPTRDLQRYVRWPRYVLLQRQKRVIEDRLRVPPSLNQFTKTLDRNSAAQVLRLLNKYKPESKSEKKERLLKLAKDKADGKTVEKGKKPNVIKYGINHVTKLVEQKEAKLVVIAHDVNPIEIVVWLPALCRRMGVPYMIIKGKSRLGALVHKKTATAVALTNVNKEHQQDFAQLVTLAKESFNDRYDDFRRQWGGGKLGLKARHKIAKKEKVLAQEASLRAKA